MEKSIYQIARERMQARMGHLVDVQAGKAPMVVVTDTQELKKAEKRKRSQEANRRYRQTEKGRLNNAKQCRKYFETHREQCQQYVIKYKAEFKEKYGVWFTAWNYWRKRLVDGKCTLGDIPAQYNKILDEWLEKHPEYKPIQLIDHD